MTLREIFQNKDIEFGSIVYDQPVIVHVERRFLRKAYDKKVFETWEANFAFDKKASKTVLSVHRRKDNPHNKYQMYVDGILKLTNPYIMEDIFEEIDLLKKEQAITTKQERDKKYKPDFIEQKQRYYQSLFDELQNVKS